MAYENYKHWVKNRILKNSVVRESGCIEYGGGALAHRYGIVSIGGSGVKKRVPAHRAMWMAVHDCFEMVGTTYVRHRCDNPCCVNIEHLETGTAKDNMRDCIERVRRAKKVRLHTRHRVHDDSKILAIRAATGKTKWIAGEFGVSIGYVSKIRRGHAKTLVGAPVIKRPFKAWGSST